MISFHKFLDPGMTNLGLPGQHDDDVISSISATSISQVARQLGQLAIIDKPATTTLATNSNDSTQSTDVNMVQTSKSSRRKSRNQ